MIILLLMVFFKSHAGNKIKKLLDIENFSYI